MRKALVFTMALSILVMVASQMTRLSAEPESPNDGEFIVHEWGTFTTFSGSDGVFMDFRPLAAEHSDLPNYVLDRGSYSVGRLFSKSRLWGRVRMETPVTYFYTDRVRTVNVRVDFPEGLLTEFYPPVHSMLPPIDAKNIFGKGELIGKSSLDWGEVDLIPIDQLVPNFLDSSKRKQIATDLTERLLPHGANEQHYAAARATDSALVHVRSNAGTSSPEAGHFEKFLFYRGVGKFQLPISAQFQKSSIVMSNHGELPIQSAILIDVDGKTIRASKLDRVDAGQSMQFERISAMTEQELAEMVHQSLVDEGLYEKEAASMVKTWQQSWFTENGTRILYTVPAQTTDELLPLHITPRPQQTLRVLVGRMEMMSPEAEQQMIQAVAQSVNDRSLHMAEQKDLKTKLPYAIPTQIRDFGRMAEPALVRVSKIARDETVRTEARLLVDQFRS